MRTILSLSLGICLLHVECPWYSLGSTSSMECDAFVTGKSQSRRGGGKWGGPLSSSSTKSSEGDCVKTADVLSLDSIRSTLIRQEETIIFALIERAQFRQNKVCYIPDGFPGLDTPFGTSPTTTSSTPFSLLEFMLMGTEKLHSNVRRYTSPEEHAFFPEELPDRCLDALPDLDYPTDLLSTVGGASSINFNEVLLQKYISWILPLMAQPGDDEQHGSSVCCDIAVLQALSRRVHYGKFVAESKYRSDPDNYQRLVDANDAEGVMALLTNLPVEKKVLQRARLKAATYGREPLLSSLPESLSKCDDMASIVAASAASAAAAAVDAYQNMDKQGSKINPTVIESIYRDFIIPLTKDIEVAYLFLRCGKQPPPQYASNRMSIDKCILSPPEEEEQQKP